MLDTCFAEFNPIVEVPAIKQNAPVAPHARHGSLGDQVTKRRREGGGRRFRRLW
jgi:hypothetical protein